MAFRTEHELHQRRRGRNVGLGLVLAAFVLLVFGLSVVKVRGTVSSARSRGCTTMATAMWHCSR